MRLKNKVAIVTGGASGIGAATCRLYAQEGAAGIVVADINEEGGRSVVDNIVKAGGEAIFVHLDVSVESQWIDTVNTTVAHYGRLDITVNNAGMSVAESRVKVEDTTIEIWAVSYTHLRAHETPEHRVDRSQHRCRKRHPSLWQLCFLSACFPL